MISVGEQENRLKIPTGTRCCKQQQVLMSLLNWRKDWSPSCREDRHRMELQKNSIIVTAARRIIPTASSAVTIASSASKVVVSVGSSLLKGL